MKVLNAEERKKSFKEIESCFSEEQALSEANRCLQCSEPGCVKGCPAGVDCKGFILKIREKNFQGALQTILEEDSLPCFTCRGCNAEQQCEGACILAKKGEAISIRALERFAVEKSELKNINEKRKGTAGKKPSNMATRTHNFIRLAKKVKSTADLKVLALRVKTELLKLWSASFRSS